MREKVIWLLVSFVRLSIHRLQNSTEGPLGSVIPGRAVEEDKNVHRPKHLVIVQILLSDLTMLLFEQS